MTSSQASESSCLLFGPQINLWTEETIEELQSLLQHDEDLQCLRHTLLELPSLWPEDFFGLGTVQQLAEFAAGQTKLDVAALSSIHLSALTIIAHATELFRTYRFSDTDQRFPAFGGVQGFCVGFLSAAATAASNHWLELQKNFCTAVRIAMCIGMVVDREQLDQDPTRRAVSVTVRWKKDSKVYLDLYLERFQNAYVSCVTDERTLTVTLPRTEKSVFLAQISASGNVVHAHDIGMKGSFHHQRHESWALRLQELFESEVLFQLPDSRALIYPLRSNSDGDIITAGGLHNIAVKSILCQCANWFQVVKETQKASSAEFLSIGKGSFVPPSLSMLPSHESPYSTGPNEIAVTGMACRYPSAKSTDEFWKLISSGGTGLSKVPVDRFDVSKNRREPDLANLSGNFLQDVQSFDHKFFNISAREAKSMDPQQRLALEVGYEALESAGYWNRTSDSRAKETDVGCYLGIGSVDYEDNVAGEDANAFSAVGTLRAFITGRISHFFGWTGPSLTIDTACSSSAVAIHAACQAIRSGECSMALAGGVNVITSPNLFQNLAAASFLSPTGSSSAFDASADGYCRGEGCGILVLKPLSKALEDQDFILGVIAGSAVSQGSNRRSITVPDSTSLSKLYRTALDSARIHPSEVTYVEAHGTGTRIGDPIEYESVRSTFSNRRGNLPIFLGSVKDNIGHTETASGVAGVIKSLLMIKNRSIPRQANFVNLSPGIDECSHIVVPTHTRPWEVQGRRRRVALINNYGAAGSNATIVLHEHREAETYSKVPAGGCLSEQNYPLLLSATSHKSLLMNLAALETWFTHNCQTGIKSKTLENICFNISRRQNPTSAHRFSANVTSVGDARKKLSRELATNTASDSPPPPRTPVVLCFGGQSSRTVILSEQLYKSSTLLKHYMDECESVCRALGVPSMYPVIFDGRVVDDLVLLHCMLFATQYATARSWIDSGLEVSTLVGHSFGQVSAWCISGALSLKEALRLVSGRARLLQNRTTGDTGRMISVEGDAKDVHEVVREVNSEPTTRVDIACYNGPRSFVLAGDSPSIESVEHIQLARYLKVRRLESAHAYHSYMLDDIIPELASLAESIKIRDPVLRIELCQRPTEAMASPLNHEAITRATRQPVYFANAVQRIASRFPTAIWLEAGSASPIISMVRRALPTPRRALDVFLPCNLSTTTTDLVRSTCEVWRQGSSARYWLFHASDTNKYTYLSLPHYQFNKIPHWITQRPLTKKMTSRPGLKPESPQDTNEDTLITKVSGNEASSHDTFAVNTLDPTFDLITRGHMVAGYNICPASFYIELASRCALLSLPKDSTFKVPRTESLTMPASLGTLIDRKVYVRLVSTHLIENVWDFEVVSCDLSGMNETYHAKGRIGLTGVEDIMTSSRLRLIKRMAVDMQSAHQLEATPYTSSISGPIVYKLFSQVVEYAAYYRGVQSVTAREQKAVGVVKAPMEQIPGLTSSASNPILVDNFLQVAGIHVNCLGNRSSGDVFMCTSIDEVMFFGPGVGQSGKSSYWSVYSANSTSEDNTVVNDIFAFESDSTRLIMVVMGATFKRVPFSSIIRSQGRAARRNATTEGNQEPAGAIHDESSISSVESISNSLPRIQALSDTRNKSARSSKPIQNRGDETNTGLQQIRQMLGNLMEVPLEQIQWTSTLDGLGIDSLMINELATEVRKRFNLGLTTAELRTLEDVQALYLLIFKDDMAESSSQAQTEEGNTRTSTPEIEASTARTSPPVLEEDDLNVEIESGFAAAGHRHFHKIKGDFSKFAEQTCLKGFASRVVPRQLELVLAYIMEAFASLGCDVAGLREGDHVPAVYYIPTHGKLVARLQSILEAQDLLTRGESGYLRTRTPFTKVPASVLYEGLLIDFPEHASETRLLHSTAHQLAECLRGSVDPISILFGNAKARALIGDVYTNAPMFKTATKFLSEFLQGVLGAWSWSQGREIHILELGGGTGGTTRFLVEHLAALGLRLTYTFSDISTSLVKAAKSRFTGFHFMKYEVLDVEKPPTAQHSGIYDVVISTNCIHATKSLVESLTNVRTMLRPDGMLCLVELTKNLDWFDLVFGLLEGWWLFDDGRQHPLADEHQWNRALRRAGFHTVDWSDDAEPESDIIRLIVASPSSPSGRIGLCETVVYKTVDGLDLFADLYYPRMEVQSMSGTSLPVALMIHGGGHVMLSRADVRPEQTRMLVDRGFIAISIDYRLCPETTLTEGPMVDVSDALQWARDVLPKMELKQRCDGIRANGSMVAAIGWSTGGFLALSLGWTSLSRGIEPPNAILAFYSPCDYEDEFWARPNIPHGSEESYGRFSGRIDRDIQDGLYDAPIASYNITGGRAGTGGWLAPDDPRSRIALYMNWCGKTLHVVLNGMTRDSGLLANGTVTRPATGPGAEPSPPTRTQIESVSLPFHVREGRFQSPTFLIHPRSDDLIPWQQARTAYDLIQEAGVEAELRVLENVGHLFDISPYYEQASPLAGQAVIDGYNFISRHVGL